MSVRATTTKKDLPRLRVAETAEELRHATWLELLYDLVFVVATAQLAHLLAEDVTLERALVVAGLAVPVWWAWAGQTFYANRFDTDDTVHRLMSVAQLLVVAVLASSIAHVLEDRAHVFALAYAGVRLVLLLEYARARRHVPQARGLIDHYLTGFSIAAALWVGSAFVDGDARYAVWVVAMVVDLGTPLLSRRQQAQLPPQSQHLPERFGLFVVIVLGECLVGIVHGLSSAEPTLRPMLMAAAGVVVVVGIWWVYFADLAEAVTARTRFAGQVWVYGHLVLYVTLIAVGVGLDEVIAHDEVERAAAWLLPLATAGSLVSLAALHAAASQWGRALPRLIGAAACTGAAVLGGAVPLLAVVVPVVAVAAQLLLELTPAQRARYLEERDAAAETELVEDVEELEARGVVLPGEQPRGSAATRPTTRA